MMIPILKSHEAVLGDVIGKAESTEEGLVVTMIEGQWLDSDLLFSTFGNICAKILKSKEIEINGVKKYFIGKLLIMQIALGPSYERKC